MFSIPKNFLVLVGNDGEVIEIVSKYSSMESISSLVAHNDKIRSWSAPHSVLLWNGSVWYPFKISKK